MKKGYLITAIFTGAALANITTLNYFATAASASVQSYQPEKSKPENPTPIAKKKVVHKEDIYRVKAILAQAEKSWAKEKFETKVKDFYYSLQLGTFKKKEYAQQFLQKLPPEIRENAFIYPTDEGYYTVRYGLFDNYKLLKDVQKEISINSIIVKTDISRIIEEKPVVKKADKKKTEITQKKKIKTPEEKPVEEEVKIVPEFEEEDISIFEEEKPQIPLYKKIAGALLFIPAYMITHKQRGFWGKVEFTYKIEDYNDKYRKTKRNSFRQYYELNYEGYVYSPRLLTYKLGGNFSREDSTTKYEDLKSETTSKLLGYDIELNFLKSSRFPINLYAKKSEAPLWYTYYDRTSYVERKTDSYGFYGNVRFDISYFNYGYRHTKSKSIGLDFREDRKSEEYLLAYGRTLSNKNLNISLKKNIDDYTQQYTTSTRNVYQDINNFLLNYRWRTGEKSNLLANARYYSNSYTNLKDYTGNVNYQWSPSEKLNTNFSFSATRSEGTNYNLTFFSFNENLNYKMNDNWNLSHNLILFTSSGTNTEQKLINTGVNINYNKAVSEKFSYFGGAGVSSQAETGNINRVGGTVSLHAGLVKRFDFLNSSFSLSGSTSQYKSSKNDRNNTYNFNERFLAYLTNNFQFEHYINYYYQDSKYYRTTGGFSETTYDNLEISNAIRYYRMLGWKGKLNASLGIKYYTGKNRTERTYPFGNLTINYKFARNLLYKMSIDVYRDSYYNADYAILKSGLDYKYRSLHFKWDLQYFYENNDNYGERRNYITMFKVYRMF
ncbi:SPOR domain-containing protein [Persephonella sp. IF05-L8]|uniref:SPOR domain-containing protein n=1 Tax=Persephonella sp. IF05-L8 TaxID=1158338 RepID=UPI000496E547